MFFSRPAGHKYVDRGDPASADFTLLDFNRDGTWRDLDLSGIVPVGVIGVELLVKINGSTEDKAAIFRKKGNSNAINVIILEIATPNNTYALRSFLACDADRFIQYNIDALINNLVDVIVCGWIIK